MIHEYTFDFNLSAWSKIVIDASSKEEAEEIFSNMTIEDIIKEISVKDYQIDNLEIKEKRFDDSDDMDESLNESYNELSPEKQVIVDNIHIGFETGHVEYFDDYDEFARYFEEEGIEPTEDLYNYYLELVDLGPSGFYEEFKDSLDFSSDFASEYSDDSDAEEMDYDESLSMIKMNEDNSEENLPPIPSNYKYIEDFLSDELRKDKYKNSEIEVEFKDVEFYVDDDREITDDISCKFDYNEIFDVIWDNYLARYTGKELRDKLGIDDYPGKDLDDSLPDSDYFRDFYLTLYVIDPAIVEDLANNHDEINKTIYDHYEDRILDSIDYDKYEYEPDYDDDDDYYLRRYYESLDDDYEKAQYKAYKILKSKKPFAVIYAYTDKKGRHILDRPLAKKDQKEVNDFERAFRTERESQKIIVHAFYLSQIDNLDSVFSEENR